MNQNLKKAGADLILNRVNDLKNIDIDFFKNSKNKNNSYE